MWRARHRHGWREPLLHRELPEIVAGVIARKKFAIVCTNALLLEKKIDGYKPSPYFAWSIHLDGDREMHDKSVCQAGVYDRAVAALKTAKAKSFASRSTARLQRRRSREDRRLLRRGHRLGVDGITVSPGYAYERAPDQKHFLNRAATKQLFRSIFQRGNGGRKWAFNQSGLFLDFLAGNQTYHCTPWGNPTRTIFGWQRPCYLLGEGYAATFKELMEETDWDAYGTGNYEKCADCMVHGGFEATAVRETVAETVEGAQSRAERRQHRRRRYGGNSAGRPTAGGFCLRQDRHAEAVRDRQARVRRKRSEEGRGNAVTRRKRPGCRAPPSQLRRPDPAKAQPCDNGACVACRLSEFDRLCGKRRQTALRRISDRTRNRKGSSSSPAKRPAMRLSMSTAAAPVARRNCGFSSAVRTGASTAAKHSAETCSPASLRRRVSAEAAPSLIRPCSSRNEASSPVNWVPGTQARIRPGAQTQPIAIRASTPRVRQVDT